VRSSCGPSNTDPTAVNPINVSTSDGGDTSSSSKDGAPDGSTQTTPLPDASVVGDGDDKCAKATAIPLGTPRSELHADTTKAVHDIDAPCSTGGGPDVFYQFTVSKKVVVYVDTFGASWDTELVLLSSDCKPMTAATMDGDSLCSDDACNTSQSRIVALLQPGNYRIGVGGKGGAVGASTVHFEVVLAPSGKETALPQGMSEQSGTTSGDSGNVQDETCLAAGPEDGFWWTSCPSDTGGMLTASTCGGATWETLLSTEIPRASTYVCASGTCNLQSAISAMVPPGAGLHQLLIDGQAATARGPYVMQVTRP